MSFKIALKSVAVSLLLASGCSEKPYTEADLAAMGLEDTGENGTNLNGPSHNPMVSKLS